MLEQQQAVLEQQQVQEQHQTLDQAMCQRDMKTRSPHVLGPDGPAGVGGADPLLRYLGSVRVVAVALDVQLAQARPALLPPLVLLLVPWCRGPDEDLRKTAAD